MESVSHSKSKSVDSISSSNKLSYALAVSGFKEQQQDITLNLLIRIRVVKRTAGPKASRPVPVLVKIKVVDLVAKQVGNNNEEGYMSISPHDFGSFTFPYKDFCDFCIGTLWRYLLQWYNNNKGESKDVGRHSALYIKTNLRPPRAMTKVL